MNYVKSTLKEGLNRRWIVDIAGRGLPTVGRRARMLGEIVSNTY